jgi:hypothetical protein
LVTCVSWALFTFQQFMLLFYTYYRVIEWVWTGFGLVIGFIDHLQIVTTCNYSAIASTHTLQFITTRTKSSQSAVSSPVVAW